MGQTVQNTYINLTSLFRNLDENGYWDFSIYDYLYINIYSEEKTSSTFIVALNCQEIDEGKNVYFYYYVTMNFKGWKELKISLSEYTKNNSHDLSKLTSLCFHSKG